MRSRPASHLVRAGRLAALSLALFIMVVAGTSNVITLANLNADRLQGISAQGPTEDYVAFYAAGRLVIEGNGQDLYEGATISAREKELMGRPVGGTGSLAFFNPPFVALGFAPFSLLPISIFPLVLTSVLALIAAGLGIVMTRFLDLRGISLVAVLAGFLSLHSVYWLLVEGQLSFFVFSAWLGFLLFQLHGSKTLSGLSLVMGLVKPQMLILLLLLLAWRREWRVLTVFGFAAGLLVACSVVVAGPEALISYPRFLIQSTGFDGHGVATEGMFGLNGLIARLTGDSTPSSLWLVALAPPILLLAVDAWRKAPPGSPGFPLALAVSLSASLLLNPHLYFQDMILVALVLAFGAHGARRTAQTTSLWAVLAAAVWIVQLYTFRLADANLNLLTPLVLGLLVVSYLSLPVRTAATRPHEAPVRDAQSPHRAAA